MKKILKTFLVLIFVLAFSSNFLNAVEPQPNPIKEVTSTQTFRHADHDFSRDPNHPEEIVTTCIVNGSTCRIE